MSAKSILEEVAHERRRQDGKWGPQYHHDAHWLAILMEEVGEAAECVCKAEVPPVSPGAEGWRTAVRAELVQVAAVAVAWIETIDGRK